MIVTREDGALRLVDQVEHGRVAGVLAAAWGNASIARPAPFEPVLLAATHHDEGWRSRDARLLFDDERGRPLHFVDVDAAEHVRLYRDGVRTVTTADAYAGLLVGMHWTGLYRGRWQRPGGAPRVGRTEQDRELQDRVVRTEQRRWVDARDQAWDQQEPRSAFETRLWHNYDLLQLWDLLSLHLVVTPRLPPEVHGPPVPWGPQVRSVDHEAGDVLLPAVGARPGGDPLRVTASVRTAGELRLDPFPFAAPLGVEMEHVMLPDRGCSQAETRSRFRRAPRETRSWRLVPATVTP